MSAATRDAGDRGPHRAAAWLDRLPWLAVAAGALGLLLHATLRDRVPYVAVLYYAMPLPAIAIVALIGLGLGIARERLAAAAACALVMAVATAAHRHEAWRRAGDPVVRGDGSIRVALWNVWRQSRHPERLTDAALAFDADVLVFVEPLRDDVTGEVLDLAPLLPGHEVVDLDGEFVVAVRGGQVLISILPEVPDASLAVVRVVLDDRHRPDRLTLCCVDVRSDPLAPRGPTLRALARAARGWASPRALLLGDFNTPRGSVQLDALREDWRDAYEEAGRGSDVTWPEPVPVLSLDHVFVGRGVRTLSFEARPTRLSDHRPVIVDVMTR